MTRPSFAALIALCAMLSSLTAFCDDTPGALPQDSTALMTLAHEKNGLTGTDIKPWHMHGTYHSYKDGKADYEGTYEEWWFRPTQYKITFTNPKGTQTDYATGTALLRDGSQDWLTGPEMRLRGAIIDPLPDPSQINGFTLQRTEPKVGKSKIECVSLTYPVRPNLQVNGDFYPAACFDPTMPVLRIFSMHGSRTIYEQLVGFQNHYVAKQVQIYLNGKLHADLTLDLIESLKQSPESILSAPSKAMPVELERIDLKESKNQWPPLLKKAVPVYPEKAKSMRIQGTVTIHGIVGADGHLEDLQLISGPDELRSAALDAVRQWVYLPMEVMGKPRQVAIEIRVIFSLG
jgi:TonB family protein